MNLRKIMELRAFSIRLAVAGMLGIGGTYGWFFLDGLFGDHLFFCLKCYVLNGFPLIVTMAIAVYSKHPLSHIFSATTSFLYTLAFALIIIGAYLHVVDGPLVILVWLVLLPYLLPLWITNLIIEICQRRKKPEP